MLRVASIAFGGRRAARGAAVRCSPPFRAPHHTTSAQALVGGGTQPRARRDLARASRRAVPGRAARSSGACALEALREPLESGVARISRVHEQLAFPAEFTLVAAMNPCFCGFRGDGTDRCKCTPYKLEQYRGRISGRCSIDSTLHVEVPRVPFADIAEPAERSESAVLREHRRRARGRSSSSAAAGSMHGSTRARCGASSKLGAEQRALLKRAADRWQLSARASLRVLKVARTIADLAGKAPRVATAHVAEALQLRCRDGA